MLLKNSQAKAACVLFEADIINKRLHFIDISRFHIFYTFSCFVSNLTLEFVLCLHVKIVSARGSFEDITQRL